jgi:catechol 2,3-dioxygenase-like lactoylglutathione lyase family enzyme
MGVHRIHHVALRVDDLVSAEAAYRDVLDLDVLFREGTYDDEFGALPEGMDWPAATRAGVDPGMTFLGREDAAIAVAQRDADDDAAAAADRDPPAVNVAGALDHVALRVDPAAVSAMAERARDRGWRVDERDDAAFLEDDDGIEWELNASNPPPETPFDPLPVDES